MANAPRRAQDMSRYVKMMHQDMASYGNLVLARCLQDMSGKGDLKWATLSCEAMWKSRCVRFINSLVWTPTRPHGPWWTLVDRVLWKFDEAVLAFLCRQLSLHSLSFTFIHFPHLAKHNSCVLLSLRSDWRRPNKFFKQKSRWVWRTKCGGQQRLLFGRGTKGWLLWLSDKLGTTNLSLMWQPSGLAVVFVGPPSIAQKLLCSLNEVFLTPA